MKEFALTIPGTGKINPPGGVPQGGTNQVENIIQWGVTAILIFSTILALFFLIYGGIRWISSGGDKAAVDGARKIITYALIGLVVVFLSFMILRVVGDFIGVSYLPAIPRRTMCDNNNPRGWCPRNQDCARVCKNSRGQFIYCCTGNL